MLPPFAIGAAMRRAGIFAPAIIVIIVMAVGQARPDHLVDRIGDGAELGFAFRRAATASMRSTASQAVSATASMKATSSADQRRGAAVLIDITATHCPPRSSGTPTPAPASCASPGASRAMSWKHRGAAGPIGAGIVPQRVDRQRAFQRRQRAAVPHRAEAHVVHPVPDRNPPGRALSCSPSAAAVKRITASGRIQRTLLIGERAEERLRLVRLAQLLGGVARGFLGQLALGDIEGDPGKRNGLPSSTKVARPCALTQRPCRPAWISRYSALNGCARQRCGRCSLRRPGAIVGMHVDEECAIGVPLPARRVVDAVEAQEASVRRTHVAGGARPIPRCRRRAGVERELQALLAPAAALFRRGSLTSLTTTKMSVVFPWASLTGW